MVRNTVVELTASPAELEVLWTEIKIEKLCKTLLKVQFNISYWLETLLFLKCFVRSYNNADLFGGW